MGLDTECNLAIEAKGDEQISDAIALLRNRLLAEHLARDPRSVSEAVRNNGGLIAGIETLRGQAVRSKKPLATLRGGRLERARSRSFTARSGRADRHRIASRGSRVALRKALGGGRSMGIVAIIILLCALALAWRYTPVRELINTDALAIIADDFAGSPFAPVIGRGCVHHRRPGGDSRSRF